MNRRVEDLSPGLNQLFGGFSLRQSAIQGWSRLSWGMGVVDALRNYPQAQASATGLNFLTLTPDSPQNLIYALRFRFSGPGRQLQSVTLSFSGSRGVADFASLNQAVSDRLDALVSQTGNITTWQRDGGQFTLSLSPKDGLVLNQSD
ncbi:conserved hypothetical protein [Desulfarculales bacterium]